jgi:hypothetical protein
MKGVPFGLEDLIEAQLFYRVHKIVCQHISFFIVAQLQNLEIEELQ